MEAVASLIAKPIRIYDALILTERLQSDSGSASSLKIRVLFMQHTAGIISGV